MNVADAPDEAAFRFDVRRWLSETLPLLAWPEPTSLEEKVPFWRDWQRRLFRGGYAGLTWDTEFGGRGLDERMRAVFGEECDRLGAPERLNIVGEDFAGPTIAHFGTTSQKARFLQPILTGEEVWCQLFSEPDSGSDLASLRTKATRGKGEGEAGGGWRIQGQKIWTSRAQLAAHAILLARTGGGPRHKGITYFLLPMDSEGLTVRPLAHMLGEAEFNEVFLDDVFLPDDAVVGEVDGGWPVAMGTLAFERVAIATGRVNTTRAVDDIIADVRRMTDPAGNPLGADPHVRQKIADLWARALVHYAIGQRVISGAAADEPPVRWPPSASSTSARWSTTSPTSASRSNRSPASSDSTTPRRRPLAPAGGSASPTRHAVRRSPAAPPSSSATSSPNAFSACREDDMTYTWHPSRDYLDHSNVARLMRTLGVATADELRARSVADIGAFWDTVVHDLGIEFRTPYSRVVDLARGVEYAEWFTGGTINIVDAALGRWKEATPGAPAIVHEAEDGTVRRLTFAELDDQVSRVRAALRARGIGKGDAVALYLPMTLEAVVATYAVASIGAMVVPLFSGFAPAAIAARIQDADAKAVITADGTTRRRRTVPLKPQLDEALKACPGVELVAVVDNVGKTVTLES